MLLALASVAIALVTLRASGAGEGVGACLVCGPHAGADAILNVALFLPVGAALALLGTRSSVALAIGFAASLTIELLQLALPLGRVASVSDLLANVLGTALAFHATRRRRAILYPRSRMAFRFATAAAVVWLLVLLGTAVLLRPSLPGGNYFGQWQPVLSEPAAPAARVVSASVAGMAVPDGRFARSEELRTALEERLQVDLQAEFGPARGSRLAGILGLVNDAGREVILVAQRGNDLLFRTRVLGSELRLVTPGVVMFDALEGIQVAEPRVIPIEGRRAGGSLRLSAYGRERTLHLHSAAGWMFMVPPGSPLLHAPALASAIWIGIPLFIIAYWVGRRARRKARRAGDAFRLTGTGGQILAALPALGALITVGLAGISLALGLTVPDAGVWAGAALATGFGLLGGTSAALSHDDRAHGRSGATSPEAALAEA